MKPGRFFRAISDDRGSVAGKLLLAFGASLLLLLVMLLLVQEMRGRVQTAVREGMESTLARDIVTIEALQTIEQIRNASLFHVIARSPEQMAEAERQRSQMVASLQDLRRRFGQIASSPRERALSQDFFDSVDHFVSVSEHTIELSRTGRKDEARDWIMERGTPAYRAAAGQAREFQAQMVAANRQAVAEIDRVHSTFGSEITLLTSLGLIFAICLYIIGIRRITHPIEHLRAAAEQVAAGRLDLDVSVQGPDEIGHLADSFMGMARTLRQRFHDMKGLVEVSRTVSSSLNLDDLLQIIADRSRILLDATEVGICLRSEGGKEPTSRTSTFSPDDVRYEQAKQESEVHLRAIYTEQTPIVAHDVAGFATALYIPLVLEGQTIGAMAFFGREGWAANEWRLEMASMLGQQAAVAIENARLHMGLREGCLSTISALAAAVEAKDSYTGTHCDHLADYGVAVAREMGLPPAEIELVRQACLLHDSGKIGIRDEILLKPGRLSQEEFDEVMKHPIIGAGIVGSASFLEDTAVLIRHHHEWYDGTGYPDGLKGEDIPLGARIVSVVDAYEAMTSDRPYRKAMTHEQAVEELRRWSGTQFDPDVVIAFLMCFHRERSHLGQREG